MGALLRAAAVFALVWATPAGAVIIASGDGTGNTSAPADDPGWNNVVNLTGLSGVYLGNGWVLTANHVGAQDMIMDGAVYESVPDSKVQLVTGGSNSDLALFQIVRDPGLPDVVIRTSPPRTSPPPQASEVVMMGRGRSRGPIISACSSDGWLWVGPSTMRWGTNVAHQNGIDLAISATLTRAFSTLFDVGLPTLHEAQAALYDSGGAVFVKHAVTGEWELAGIITSIDACQVDAAVYGDLTYAADLSFYLDQINVIAGVPACDDGRDDDGDGLIDYPDDPGCDDLLDPFETSDALPCDDGFDNDDDGRVDFDPVTYTNPGDETSPPAGDGDPGCGNPTWGTETPRCQDGIDNDGDGMMDYDAGYSANGFADPDGPDPQCVDNPWRNSESPSSYPCGLGVELALLLPPLLWMRRRRGSANPRFCPRWIASRRRE